MLKAGTLIVFNFMGPTGLVPTIGILAADTPIGSGTYNVQPINLDPSSGWYYVTADKIIRIL